MSGHLQRQHHLLLFTLLSPDYQLSYFAVSGDQIDLQDLELCAHQLTHLELGLPDILFVGHFQDVSFVKFGIHVLNPCKEVLDYDGPDELRVLTGNRQMEEGFCVSTQDISRWVIMLEYGQNGDETGTNYDALDGQVQLNLVASAVIVVLHSKLLISHEVAFNQSIATQHELIMPASIYIAFSFLPFQY